MIPRLESFNVILVFKHIERLLSLSSNLLTFKPARFPGFPRSGNVAVGTGICAAFSTTAPAAGSAAVEHCGRDVDV